MERGFGTRKLKVLTLTGRVTHYFVINDFNMLFDLIVDLNISSRFSSNSEAFASKLLDHHEEKRFSRKYGRIAFLVLHTYTYSVYFNITKYSTIL